MKSSRRWLVLDLDGTLLDISRRHYLAYRASLPAGMTGVPPRAYWNRVRRGPPPPLDRAGRRRFVALIERPALLRLDRPARGAHLFLRRAARQFKLLLLTGRRRAGPLRRQLAGLGWLPFLDRIASSAAGARTPSARCRLVRRTGGLRPRNLLALLGDTDADVLTARGLEIPCFAVSHGLRSAGRLRKAHPSVLCRDLPSAWRHLMRWKTGGFADAPSGPRPAGR